MSACLAAIYGMRRNVGQRDAAQTPRDQVDREVGALGPGDVLRCRRRLEPRSDCVFTWTVSTSDISSIIAHGTDVVIAPTVAAVCIFWLESLFAARSTCRAALLRLEEVIKKTNPLNAAEWDKEVSARALKLAHEIMPTINDGWSPVIALILLRTLCGRSLALIKLGFDAGRAELEAAPRRSSTSLRLPGASPYDRPLYRQSHYHDRGSVRADGSYSARRPCQRPQKKVPAARRTGV